MIKEFESMLSNYKRKSKSDDSLARENDHFRFQINEQIRDIKFSINTIKNEVLVVKSIATPENFSQISKSTNEI